MTTISALQTANNYLSLSTVDTSVGQSGNTSNTNSSGSPTSPSSVSDIVTLSPAATAALNATTSTTTDSQVSYYAQFFPTRDGTASTLATAIINPSATTISTGLTASGIAEAARVSMDKEYAAMAASGTPYNVNSKDGIDSDTLMSGLDRTALTAVASNQDGLFTKTEQDTAQSLMTQQQGMAMGLYEGPIDLESKWVNVYGSSIDSTQSVTSMLEKASVFLDNSSNYEKGTVAWAFSRASVQTAYEGEMDAQGQTYDPKYISNLTIVGMLVDSMKNAQANGIWSYGSVNNEQDLLSEPWAKGHETQIEQGLAQTRKELGLSES